MSLNGVAGPGAFPFALILAFLLLASFQTTNAASVSTCNVSTCWTELAAPVFAQLGAYSSFQIVYANNNMNTNVTGIIFMVVHNYLGQTVEISTATLQLAAGTNGTAHPIIFGLASDTYSATFFVTSTSGVAISTTTAESFTI